MRTQASRIALSLVTLSLVGACPGRGSGPSPDRPRRGAAKLSPVERLQHAVRQGADAWRRSCPVAQIDGLCVESQARPGHWKLRARSADAVARARSHFTRAWAAFEELRASPAERPRAETLAIVAAAGEAGFGLAEIGLEDYFRLAYPAGLEMNPANPEQMKHDMAQFKGWLKAKLASAAGTIKSYMKILTDARLPLGGKKVGAATWAVAALYRTGLIFQQFGEALRSVPVPASLQIAEARQAYRDQLDKFSAPLFRKAQTRYRMCLKIGKDLAVSGNNPWLRRCAEEHERLGR